MIKYACAILLSWPHQLLHSSDCAVSVAEGICQPTHSIGCLAVPIETDGNAGTNNGGGRGERDKRSGGDRRQDGEDNKNESEDTGRPSKWDRWAEREACELCFNPVGSEPSQLAPFSWGRKTPYRTMETQWNGPAMPQSPHCG